MRPTAANRRFRRAPLVAAITAALLPFPAQAVTYFVTSPLDNSGNTPTAGAGTGTLRQAIVDANANCASDPSPVIAFAIGTSPTFIGIGSPAPTTTNPLPQLTCATMYNPVIDATTQPGSVPNSQATGSDAVYGIILDGSGLQTAGCGISYATGVGGGRLTVRGLHFLNFSYGSSAGLCGGVFDVMGNRFESNFNGIVANASGPFSYNIGSAAAADRNYFLSNISNGITVSNTGPTNITNNYIGTTPSGTAAQANGSGIVLSNSFTTTIQGNVISGNSFAGINLANQQVALIYGNRIGVGATGGAVPNVKGITISNFFATPLTDINNGNEIAFNTQYGVDVQAGKVVRVTNSSVYGNGVKNINLDMYGGPVINDFQDPDTGPNDRQNHPVLTTVTSDGTNTFVRFTFNSTPNTSHSFDVYANSGPGIPAGRTFVTSVSNFTDANGDYNLYDVFPIQVSPTLDYFSVTARRNGEDVSEFSPIVAVTGSAPGVNVSSPTMTFGNVPTGTTSPTQTVTLTSTGTAPWMISQIGSPTCYGGPVCYGGAEFTCATTCLTGNPYALNQACTLTGNFHPTFLGPQTVTVQYCDNAVGSPRTITLSGNGVAPSTIVLTPTSFDFGNVPVNTNSARAFFTVQNPAATPVDVSATISGPYAILASSCTNPRPPSSSCDLDVVFAPNAAGIANGVLTVTPSAGAPVSASLLGNGVVAPLLALPSNIDIPYTLGRPAATQVITLANSGTAPLTFSSIVISGLPFTLVNNCPSTLPPGSSCDLIVGFSEANRGTFTGTLTIMSNAPGGSRTINLRGLANPREVPVLEVTPREIGYGQLAFGSVTEGEPVTIRNIGGAPAIFDSFVVSADFVVLSHTCVGPLVPLEKCEALVAMRPTAYGVRFGTLRILSNAENSPNLVDIFGTSCRATSLVLPRLGRPGGCAP